MPSSAAWRAACTAPMPPKATRSSSRASAPARERMRRTASHMCASMMATVATAASSASSPSGLPTAARAWRAPSTSRSSRPLQNAVGVEAAQDQVGVGHGGLGPAPPVAHRARDAARRFGPDGERAGAVAAERPAAGPDGVHVDHREGDAVAVPPVPVRLHLRPAVADQADVVAGAAHVDADDVTEPGCRRGTRRRHDPARRARS